MLAIVLLAILGLVMSVRSMISTIRARALRRQRGELRANVGALQDALLPAPPGSIEGVHVSVAYRPATGPAAGGDFHDVLALEDGRIGVIVGDVSGHGPAALALTPLVHYTVRAHLEAGLSPGHALARADRSLDGKLGDDFATVVAAVYDPATGRLRYSTAGHPVPIFTGLEAPDPIELLTPPPVGIGPPTGTRQTTVPVAPGAVICFFSDGLIEARAKADPHDLLGHEGLGRILAESPDTPSAEEVLDRIDQSTEGRRDDMTACLLAPESSPAAGHPVEELELTESSLADDRLEEFLELCGLDAGERSDLMDSLAAGAEHGPVVLRVERDPAASRWTVLPAEEPVRPALAGAFYTAR